MANRPRTIAREISRRLGVQDGDIILMKLKHGGNNFDGRTFEAIRNAMFATDRKNCVVIAVDDLSQIEVLDEEEMNALGWFRADINPSILAEEE
jgi:hypothetical protein